MKLLTTTLVLLAGMTMASAEPKLGTAQPTHQGLGARRAEGTARLVLEPRKQRAAPKPPAVVDGWTEVTGATPARFGTSFVTTDGRVAMTKLRVNAVVGTVVLRRVKVHFTDGTSKVFALSRTLDSRKRGSTVIDLGGAKLIDEIDITTERRPAGEYSIDSAGAIAASSTCC